MEVCVGVKEKWCARVNEGGEEEEQYLERDAVPERERRERGRKRERRRHLAELLAPARSCSRLHLLVEAD